MTAAGEQRGKGASTGRPGSGRGPRAPGASDADRGETLAALIGAGGLLALGALLFHHYRFAPPADRGVVSWVTVHAYPVQQEPVALLGALVCVLVGVALGHAFIRYRAARAGASGAGASEAEQGTVPGDAGAASRRPRSALRGLASVRARRFLICGVVPLLLYALFYDAGVIFLVPLDVLAGGERRPPMNALCHRAMPFRVFYVQHGLGQDVGKAWLALRCLDGTLASLRLVECALRPLGPIALYLLGLALFRRWPPALICVALVAAGLAAVAVTTAGSGRAYASPNHAHHHYHMGVRAYAGTRHAPMLYQEAGSESCDPIPARENAAGMERPAAAARSRGRPAAGVRR